MKKKPTDAAKASKVRQDAKPQFVRTRHGSTNSGVASAEPRVISHDEGGDATIPLKQGRKGK